MKKPAREVRERDFCECWKVANYRIKLLYWQERRRMVPVDKNGQL